MERFSRSRNNSGLIAIFLNFRGSLDADFRDTVIGGEGDEFGEISFLRKVRSKVQFQRVILIASRVLLTLFEEFFIR